MIYNYYQTGYGMNLAIPTGERSINREYGNQYRYLVKFPDGSIRWSWLTKAKWQSNEYKVFSPIPRHDAYIITFHSYAAKRTFIREQKVSSKEILKESEGSIVVSPEFWRQADWEQNHAVYSVEPFVV